MANIPDITWTIDSTGHVAFTSPHTLAMLGYAPEELSKPDLTVMDLVHPDDGAAVGSALEDLFAHGVALDVECRVRHKDGRWIWTHARASHIYERDGMRYADGLTSDITPRKLAEIALRHKEEQYQRLVANLPDVTWTAKADGSMTYVSRNVETVFGYTADEACASGARIWRDLIHPDDARQVFAAYAALFAADRPFDVEFRCRRKDGEWVCVHDRAHGTYERDGIRYADGLLVDITARKRIDDLLADSERRYRLLAENMTDFVWTCDLDGRPTYISPSVTALTGFSADEVLDRGFEAILTPEALSLIRNAMGEAFASTPPNDREDARARAHTLELEHLRRDGTTVWAEVRAAILLNEAGRPTGFMGVSRDITEHKAIERMRTDFVSFTTHQLRTPLTGIKWMLELAMGASELSVDTRSYMDDALGSTNRLVGLVNDLLATSRLESGRVCGSVAPLDLTALTHDVLRDVEVLVHKSRLHVSVETEAGVGLLEADAMLLRQAVMNLVGNAIKFTPADGSIAIRIVRQGPGVRWEIRDSGIGIPRAEQDRLFQKFYRAESGLTVSPEGTGLGLYLVRLIAERLGGTVGVESEQGKGALFFFTIPCAP